MAGCCHLDGHGRTASGIAAPWPLFGTLPTWASVVRHHLSCCFGIYSYCRTSPSALLSRSLATEQAVFDKPHSRTNTPDPIEALRNRLPPDALQPSAPQVARHWRKAVKLGVVAAFLGVCDVLAGYTLFKSGNINQGLQLLSDLKQRLRPAGERAPSPSKFPSSKPTARLHQKQRLTPRSPGDPKNNSSTDSRLAQARVPAAYSQTDTGLFRIEVVDHDRRMWMTLREPEVIRVSAPAPPGGSLTDFKPSQSSAPPHQPSIYMPGGAVYHVDSGQALDTRVTAPQSSIVLEAVVGADGSVKSVESLSGPGPLAAVAMDAVSNWHFKPEYRNGQPVESVIKLTIDMTSAH